MILLKELKLNNFLSHESTTLNFTEMEKLLLDGRSGSGKSSITEAIFWVFYGRGRADNRSLVRRGAKSATVSLKLTDGPTETLITRSISAAGKNTLAITQNTGSKGQFLPIERTGLKDTQDWIEKEFLKASYELFTNSVAYPQENENSFVKSNATRRKDLLLEIVRAGNFDVLYEKSRIALATNQLENATNLANVKNTEEEIKLAETNANTYDGFKKKNDEVSVQIDSFVSSEKDIEKRLNDITQITRQISDKKSIREALVKSNDVIEWQLGNDQRMIAEFANIDIETAKKNVKEAESLSIGVEDIKKKIREISENQQRINAHLSNKPSVFDYTKDIEIINQRLIPLIKDSGKCPSGDDCPFVVPIKGQIDFLTQQINEKTERGKLEKRLLDVWSQEYAKLVPVQDSSELYTQITVIEDRINTLNRSKEVITRYEMFAKTNEEIKSRGIKLNEDKVKNAVELARTDTQIYELEQTLVNFDVNKVNIELTNVRMMIQNLRKEKEVAVSGMTIAAIAGEELERDKIVLAKLQVDLKKAEDERESLELLKEALSPRGIKAVVIDYLVPQLEERINGVLSQMSEFRIRLDTQRATVDEEGVKEGLFITVLNDQKEELPFASYSGGEKVKITVAISEALASLMTSIGFRIMDENIVSLDKESTEGFVVVLEKLQEKFPQLLVISHLQEVKDLFSKQVTITKVNGISKIV